MDLLDLYFKSNPNFIVKHHLDSYNEFIDTTIQKVIESMNPFPIVKPFDHISVTVGTAYCTTPLTLPSICRLKNETYQCQLKAHITVTHVSNQNKTPKTQVVTYNDVFLCNLPVMLHSNICRLNHMSSKQLIESGECPYDHGGYFIVAGKEKVIISQERTSTNKLFIIKALDTVKHHIQASITCTSESDSVFPKTLWLYNSIKDGITVRVTHIDTEIPLFTLFRALGVESDKAILQMIWQTVQTPDMNILQFMRPTIVHAGKMACFTQESSLHWLMQFTKYNNVEHVNYILKEDFLPNVPFNNYEKALYLGMLVKELLSVAMGRDELTNRDNYINKRVGISGYLMGDIFKDFYNNFRVKTRTEIDNQFEFGRFSTKTGKPEVLFTQSQIFRDGLIKSLKGNWGLLNDSSKQGIVQDLNRISYMSFVSHLRRVTTPIDSSVKIRTPHQLDGSQWGVMCPCESPDGASIGLLKNMSIMCSISSSYNAKHIISALTAHDHIGFKTLTTQSGWETMVTINNNWIGEVKNPVDVVLYLRLLKLNAYISPNVSITWKVFKNRIDILTDSGRCCRPLLRVDQGVPVIDMQRFKGSHTWEQLVGIVHDEFINPFITFDTDDWNDVMTKMHATTKPIEWVDVEEMNLIKVAMDRKTLTKYTTHLEIHPSTMLSAYTSTIPFLNHNQAPRNIFSGAQGKQAIGVYATNFASRIDTMGYILHYPQQAIVRTKYAEYLHTNMLPNGENLIIAIMTYTGYNQEDSLIVNEASIKRGMFNITGYKAHVAEEEKTETNEIFFANPLDVNIKKQKYANYSTMHKASGMPIENAKVEEGDCIFGMVSKEISSSIRNDKVGIFDELTKEINMRNVSVIADKTIQGTIDKVFVSVNKDNNKKAKMRLRKFKIPELGDKMASRHGQKGVVGMIIPQEDMPFTKDGLIPDIIVNPHAFPTRMTIGHLLESLIAKYYCVSGKDDAFIPFDDFDVKDINEGLKNNNYNSQGDELLYNGISGLQMECEIFIGPTYYFRLKHMVSDKINYRVPDGKVIGLTKQPPKGRSNGGGLRIGEMETNLLLSHGFGAFTKESMMERSDKHTVYVNDVGIIVPYNKKKKIGYENVRPLDIPYSMKLLLQELNAASIGASFVLDEEFTYSEEDYTSYGGLDDDV
jgi:DNA-directed RNA polymerase II subunit RPB2